MGLAYSERRVEVMKYWAQIQAPAGNWVDVLGTDDLETAFDFADWHREKGDQARVVKRIDLPLEDPRGLHSDHE
jgi:hypothetical protein